MDLYDAIFVRKTVEHYLSDSVPAEMLEKIRAHFQEIKGLYEDIPTAMTLVMKKESGPVHVGLFPFGAPYYLVFYTGTGDRSLMNIGTLMQQMALFLCTCGLGSTFMRKYSLPRKLRKKGTLPAVGVIAFGYARGSYTRSKIDADRLPLNTLCIFREQPKPWVRQILDAARYAPSFLNDQPWRFIAQKNDFHILSKKYKNEQMIQWTEMSIGILLANIIVAAEVLWLDIDLIRLDNFSQKNFPHSRYVMSAFLHGQDTDGESGQGEKQAGR